MPTIESPYVVSSGAIPCDKNDCKPFFIREWEFMILIVVLMIIIYYASLPSRKERMTDFSFSTERSDHFTPKINDFIAEVIPENTVAVINKQVNGLMQPLRSGIFESNRVNAIESAETFQENNHSNSVTTPNHSYSSFKNNMGSIPSGVEYFQQFKDVDELNRESDPTMTQNFRPKFDEDKLEGLIRID